MILYVNACVRAESRTNRLAKALLNKLGAYEEIRLTDLVIKPLNGESLNYREAQIGKGNYDDSIFDLSKQFAEADLIVISAPYWDAQFPAVLKTYIENIWNTAEMDAHRDCAKQRNYTISQWPAEDMIQDLVLIT